MNTKKILKIISILLVLLSLLIAYASLRYCGDYHLSIDPQQLAFSQTTATKIKVKHLVPVHVVQGALPNMNQGLYEVNIRYSLPQDYDNRRNRAGFFFIKLNKKTILLKGIKIKAQAIFKLQLFIVKGSEELLEYGLAYLDAHLKIESVHIKSSIAYQQFLWILCSVLLLLAALLQALAHPKYEMFELMWMGIAVAAILWFPPLQIAGEKISFAFLWQHIFYPGIGIWALLRFVFSRPQLEELGLGILHFQQATRYLLLPLLFAISALLFTGWWCESIHLGTEFFSYLFPLYSISPWLFFAVLAVATIYVLYKNNTSAWVVFFLIILVPLSALLQQFAVQCFFHRQVKKWSPKRSILIVVVFFVVMHVPNPFVMLGTMYLMYFWAKCYQKYPNIYALAFSHHIISCTMKFSMPAAISTRAVGYNFLEEIFWLWSNYFLV